MNNTNDVRNAVPPTSRRPRGTVGTAGILTDQLPSESKRVTTRSGRRRRSAHSSRSPKDRSELNFRGGNELLLRTAAEGIPALKPSSRLNTPGFGISLPPSTRLDSEVRASRPKRVEFCFLEVGNDGSKTGRRESSSGTIDLCTCSTEIFDKWLISTLATIPPNTASTLSLRSGAVASQKAQKKFIFRESILNNIFNLIQSGLEVLQRYQLELYHNQNLLDAYYAALEEDALDRKAEAGKWTAFHYSIREKKRVEPNLKYQASSAEIESRINKMTHVIHRLEVLEGLHAIDASSDSQSVEEVRGENTSNPDQMYGHDVETDSDEDTVEVLQEGSAEKDKAISKIKRIKLLKILARKSKGLQECVELPLRPHEITSRLRNDLVLPFCARVLSLKEISTKKGREDQIRSFVEWYVNKMVDPFAMAQLLRIVPMEYVVTTTCRLVSVCDGDLSLRATQALPDFSHVIIRAIREGREEAFSQLLLSPSVAFLSGLKNALTSKILFYACVLVGHLDVLRRVLSCGFFHPQVLFVLLFFNANWECDDCANYLRHELKLCHEMSDLHYQLKKPRRNNTTGLRTGLDSTKGTVSSLDRALSSRLDDTPEGFCDTKLGDTMGSERRSPSSGRVKDKVYNFLEITLRALFAEDMDTPSSNSTVAEQFIYQPLNVLRTVLEMRETTHREVHAFASSLATSGINSTGGKDRTVALFHDVGVDINGVGSALRRELEGLRWHSYFVGKNKVYTSLGALGDTISSQSLSQQQDSPGDSPNMDDGKKPSIPQWRDDSFGTLLRGCWLDALIGRPLANVMLPTFSTKWLRRTDSRSYLPIAPTGRPLLIRSDCSVNFLDASKPALELFSLCEALEAKEVKEAEDLRSVRALSTMDFLTAPLRAAEGTNDFHGADSPTGSVIRGGRGSRKNRSRQDTYEGNYYFEVHVSLDYLLASSGSEEEVEGEPLCSDSESNSKSLPSLSLSGGRTGDARVPPPLPKLPSVNSLILGFCSENSEADPAGVDSEHSKELGGLPGSGGISLQVVGYREGVDVLQEDESTVKQVDEVVLKILRHQDGKTFPVLLPFMEKGRQFKGSYRKRLQSTAMSSASNMGNCDQSALGHSTEDPTLHSQKTSYCSSVVFSENENTTYRGDRSSVMGTLAPDTPQASFVFLQFTHRRNSNSPDLSLNAESYSQLTSPSSMTEANTYTNSSYSRAPRFYEDDESVETIFPYTQFISEKEFRDWKATRTRQPCNGGETGPPGILGAGFCRKSFDAIHDISHTCIEPLVTPERTSYQGSATSVFNCSVFGHVGLSLGFFVDVKRKVVSLSVNGIPAGTPFSRLSSTSVERLYPAATLHSSVSVVDFLLQSEEHSSLSSTLPIIRFAFDKEDLLGDLLWEARKHAAGYAGAGGLNHPPPLSLARAIKGEGLSPGKPDRSCSASKASTYLPVSQQSGKALTPTVTPRSVSGPATDGAAVSAGSTGPGGPIESTFYAPDSFLKGVKLLDKQHKFKLILDLLSTRVESGDAGSPNEVNVEGHRKGAAGIPGTNGGSLLRRNSGNDLEIDGASRLAETAGELHWHQRSHRALNHLSTGGFHDFIFFPSIHIRRRSDDDWKDLQYNGVPIIPERSVLSPLCAALASRQPLMALAIASNPMTNMYHATEAAVRQRRLALLGACALGYAEVVQVLLERMPAYEVLSLFSIQIQRDEWENLRREHKKRNILVSRMGMPQENTSVGGEGNGQLPKRTYAVTPVNKLDPQKMYTSKGSQYTPIHCALLGGNHTAVVTVLLNYLYSALAFKPYSQLSVAYCKEYRDAEASGKIFYVGKTYPHLKDVVNVSSKAGETALLMATRMNNAIIAKRLLAFGATPHCQDRISRAFAFEIACSNQFLPIAQALFSTNAYSSPLMLNHAGVATPLCWCAINNLAEMIPPLLKNGADPMKGLDGNSPLLLAVTFRSEEAALCLLRYCCISHSREEVPRDPNIPIINVNDVDARTQCTALHIACELGMVEVVRALLHSMAALTVVTKGTYLTPLHTAILNGEMEAALTLLEFGKDQLRRCNVVLNINAIDKNGNTPLHLAVRAGMAEVVEYIVAQYSSEEMNLLSKNHPGWKAPHPVDFMHTNNQGKIPLLVAIQFHEVKCAELIIAYSVHENIRNPGGTVIDETCMAILQAISAGLDEVVLLLLSYPQYPVNVAVKESFMQTYTAQRNTFDQLEAQQLIEAQKAKKEAARKAREEEEEIVYRYFPVIKEEKQEVEDEESMNLPSCHGDSAATKGFRDGHGRASFAKKESNEGEGNDSARVHISGEPSGGTLGRPATNYTGALISRTKAYCPPARKGTLGGWRRAKGVKNKRRMGDNTSEKRSDYHRYEGHSVPGRNLFVKELFARSRSKIAPEMALKLLLRGFAFPELFVILEEVAAQSLVVGIQSPSAMVNSESMLGFLKEHFGVSILPSNAVKFARDLLEHIISMFENMSAKKEEFPSWYYARDQVGEAMRRYPPFCQNIVRIIRLYGKQDNSVKAIEHIRAALTKKFLETRLPSLNMRISSSKGRHKEHAEESAEISEQEELEKLFVTPFRYTVLQLVTNLRLGPLVSFFLHDVHLSPFYVPIQDAVGKKEMNLINMQDGEMEVAVEPPRDAHSPSHSSPGLESQKGFFEYDILKDDRFLFKDLYNFSDSKWCCSPYRLAIRSFHPQSVSSYLLLFHISTLNDGGSNFQSSGQGKRGLSHFDIQRVQARYEECFGIKPGKLPVGVMAVDYREPDWVDPIGSTALQELLADHLTSRLAPDDAMERFRPASHQKNLNEGEVLHLNRSSSLEMFRGDMKGEVRAILKQLLGAGAAASGCFNNMGLDAWLMSFNLDDDAGRAATSILLRSSTPLFGVKPGVDSKTTASSNVLELNFTVPSYVDEKGPISEKNFFSLNGQKEGYLSDEERVVEEMRCRVHQLHEDWETAGYGIPYASPEVFENLRFTGSTAGGLSTRAPSTSTSSSSLIRNDPEQESEGRGNGRAVVSSDASIRLVASSSGVSSEAALVDTVHEGGKEKGARNVSTFATVCPDHPSKEFRSTLTSEKSGKGTARRVTRIPFCYVMAKNGADDSTNCFSLTPSHYATFLLFGCIEHNHKKLIPLLEQYPSVLLSNIRHPFTHDSLLTRLLKKAVEELIFLGELPAVIPRQSLSTWKEEYQSRKGSVSSTRLLHSTSPQRTLPLSHRVGSALWEASHHSCKGNSAFSEALAYGGLERTNKDDSNALGNIQEGYHDPCTIPVVRSMLDVAKALLDKFEFESRFEPCAEGETAISLASIIGHAPLVSRIVLPFGKPTPPGASSSYGKSKGGHDYPELGNTIRLSEPPINRLSSPIGEPRLGSMDKTTAPNTEALPDSDDNSRRAEKSVSIAKSAEFTHHDVNHHVTRSPNPFTNTIPSPSSLPFSTGTIPGHQEAKKNTVSMEVELSAVPQGETLSVSAEGSPSCSSPRRVKPNPLPTPYTLSSALENAVVRTMLATRLYWSEEDAPTLYTLLDHMAEVDHQVEFLALAYPNIHPLPALWLAVQYVTYANSILYRHECNTAFWGNLLFAQYSGGLDELPVHASAWNDLLRVLLPRAPAIPVYLIYSHFPGIDTTGNLSFRSSLRRRALEDLCCLSPTSECGDALHSARYSERSQSRAGSERYPRLKINHPRFMRSVEADKSLLNSPSSPTRTSFLQQSDEVITESVLDQRGTSEFSFERHSSQASSYATVFKPPDCVNNWQYIVKRVFDFLKVSALIVAQSIFHSGNEIMASRGNKGKKMDGKNTSTGAASGTSFSGLASSTRENKKAKLAIPAENAVDGLSGTLLLDVIEVATRYDHPEAVMELVRLRALMHDVISAPTEQENENEWGGMTAEEQRIRREQEQSTILSGAVVVSSCHTLSGITSLPQAYTLLSNLEKGVWKELIEIKRLDLVAVAAGSQKVLRALYEDEMTASFLSVFRYDRINILNGIPENMYSPLTDENTVSSGVEENNPEPGTHVRDASQFYSPPPGLSISDAKGEGTSTNTMSSPIAFGTPNSVAFSKGPESFSGEPAGSGSIGSVLTGCLREYVLLSLRALVRRFPDAVPPLKHLPPLHWLLQFRPIDWEQVQFCRRCAGRQFIGTQEDRNAIANTTWGVGGAAKMLQLPATHSSSALPEIAKAACTDGKRDVLEISQHSSLEITSSGAKAGEGKGDSAKRLLSLVTPPHRKLSGKDGKAEKGGKGNPASLSITATKRTALILKPPKPVYQLFLQTDWVVHPSQVLRSPRPSVQTVDMLVFLLEKRAPLSISALQMFFSASHFHNTWRSSRGEIISLNYQTASHQDTLLHILVMNDQYQLTEYFLTYALYYFCKWAFDDPNLRPGVFTVRECAPKGEEKGSSSSKGGKAPGEGKGEMKEGSTSLGERKEKNELMAMVRAATEAASKELEEQDRAKEPATFLRMMLRLNRHGLAAFDYARSANMVQLLQRFGCVPPSYRPNPQTFTRALGLFRMLQMDTTIPNEHYFSVPQIILSSDHFLRCEDGRNHILINRQAGLKTNESNKIKQEKALLATFQVGTNPQKDNTGAGAKPKGWGSSAASRSPAGKSLDQTGDAALIRHLMQTQKITGALVLPLILNEDVSLLHLGLCAHDDELVQLFGRRKNNLLPSSQAVLVCAEFSGEMPSPGGGSAGLTVGFKDLPCVSSPSSPPESLACKAEGIEEPMSLSQSLSQAEQEAEEKELFSPYLLSLLPQEMTTGEGGIGEKSNSPAFSKSVGFGARLPPLRDGAHRQPYPLSVSTSASGSASSAGFGRLVPSDGWKSLGQHMSPSVALGGMDFSGAGLAKGGVLRRPVAPPSMAQESSKAAPKLPLTQRDIITLLEKRQFIVYPLSLPAAPAPTTLDINNGGQRNGIHMMDTKKPLKKHKNLATCAAMAEEVFLRHQMDFQHSNAEAMVEEADAINCAAFLVSMTPMQLMQSTMKLAGEARGQLSGIGQQYYSIPAAKLSLYFSCTNLPENAKSVAIFSRHEAAEVFAETNMETTRLLQNFYVTRNSAKHEGELEGSANSTGPAAQYKDHQEGMNEREDPLRQVVSVPILQPQAFCSLKPSAVTNYPQMLDDWVDQFRVRKQKQVHDGTSNGGTRNGEGGRKKHKRAGNGRSSSKKAKERSQEGLKRRGKGGTGHFNTGEGRAISRGRRVDGESDGASTDHESSEDVEVSPIHTVQPVGGVASAEQQGLMRILLRQFSSSAGSKLSHDMGLHIAPNYNVESCGDPIAITFGKGPPKEKS